MWPRFSVLYTSINKYSSFSDTALITGKNLKPHHRILQCKAIQHVGGRDIAFKWSSLLENLKSGVRDEGDTAQHSTWGSSGIVCVYIGVGGWVGGWEGLHFFHTSHAWIKYLAHCHNYINTFTAVADLSRFNNSCLKSPASTLVDLTFQSRALRSFSLNQLRNLSL